MFVSPADLLKKTVRFHGDRTAVWLDGYAQTYAQLWDRGCRLANALSTLGVRPGDRVALLGDNTIHSAEQVAGTAIANVVRCPLYAHVDADSNIYALTLVDAKVLIVQRRYYDGLAHRLTEVPTLEHVIVFDGDEPPGTHSYEKLLSTAVADDPRIPVAAEDNHMIRFSAGTTGRPKGILHTAGGWLDKEFALIIPRLDDDDCYLAAGPLTHASGVPFWPLACVGAKIVVMPNFSPELTLELIEQHRVTLALLVPTMVKMIVDHPDAQRRDLSSLRAVLYGASPVPEQTIRDALAVWGPIMYQTYGQSECLPISVLTPKNHRPDGDERERSWLRSAGQLAPYVTATVVDDDGNELPIGEIGEVAAKSPGQMKEIWKDPEATRQRLLPDGSVRTRDVGYFDDDGFLYLCDRKEDMVISGGFNIWPAELENALMSHPAVRDVAVVGVPHDKWGETVKGVVVLHDGAAVDEAELIEWTRERVGSTKKVTSVDFVDRLPRSAVGKVLRREIRERYWPAGSRHGASD